MTDSQSGVKPEMSFQRTCNELVLAVSFPSLRESERDLIGQDFCALYFNANNSVTPNRAGLTLDDVWDAAASSVSENGAVLGIQSISEAGSPPPFSWRKAGNRIIVNLRAHICDADPYAEATLLVKSSIGYGHNSISFPPKLGCN